MGMTGVNVAPMGQDYWEDTGGMGGGMSTLTPIPAVGMKLDPASQAFVDTSYITKGQSLHKSNIVLHLVNMVSNIPIKMLRKMLQTSDQLLLKHPQLMSLQ